MMKLENFPVPKIYVPIDRRKTLDPAGIAVQLGQTPGRTEQVDDLGPGPPGGVVPAREVEEAHGVG